MSYAYRSSAKVSQKPQRPLGVALIGGIGILVGLIWAILIVYALWMSSRQGLPLAGQGIRLAGSLLAALIVIWIYWGLLDMLRWAWWLNVVLAAVSVVALGAMFGYVPDLVSAVFPKRPDETIRTLTLIIYGSMAFGLVFNLVTAIYLVTARKVFGIGVKDRRPLWERARL